MLRQRMKFENRAPDESVNYSIEHPLKEFAWLVSGVFGALFMATLLIGYFAGELAARLPYRYEAALASTMTLDFTEDTQDVSDLATEQALNQFAVEIAAGMQLPEGMQIRVHYAAAAEVNAFATLGANIVINQGLLAQMPDENTLAMVIGHEIAHAALRHPARSLGRGVAIGIIMTSLGSNMGHNAASGALAATGQLTALQYSREQERRADIVALAAVEQVYGHVGGAQDVFRILRAASGGDDSGHVSMLSTHPLSQARIDAIAATAAKHRWTLDGERTPLRPALHVTQREG